MNMILKVVICLTIIIGMNPCFCKEYSYLKTVVENMDSMSEKLQSRVAMWDLLAKVLQYESFITLHINAFHEEKDFPFNTFIKLLQKKVGLPVNIIESNDKHPKETTNLNNLYHYVQNANTSYVLIMDLRLYSTFFAAAKTRSVVWDPKANFVLVTNIISMLKLKTVFRKMWKTHGIHKVIAIDLESERVVAYNSFKDQMKVFNDSDIEKIVQYRLLKHGLDRYPIKVAMYENQPTSIAIPNSKKFRGVEQMLIDTLENSLNFSLKMYKITDFSSTDSGPIPTILKKVVNREVDLAANMYFIKGRIGSPKDGYEYSSPFFSDRLYFIVPKAKKIPLWLSMYLVFDNQIWISSALIFGLIVVLWLCILKFSQRQKIRRQIGYVTINVLFLLSGQSIPVRMTTYSKQLLFVCGSIFAIIMVNCFSGDLFRRFSKDTYYPDINSFKELEKSGLDIQYAIWGGREILNGSDDPSLNKIQGKPNLSSAFNLTNGVLDHAILSRVSLANYEVAKSLIANNGTILLHRIKEPVAQFSMAYIVPYGWAFMKKFNLHISRILEAGLIQKWYYDNIFNETLWKLKTEHASSKTIPRAFTLSDLRLAWILLGIGLSISFLVFLMELAWHSISHKRARRTLPTCKRAPRTLPLRRRPKISVNNCGGIPHFQI